MSKIDGILVSREWEEHFVRVIQSALPKGLLDDRPIKLNLECVDWRPRSYRFGNCGLMHKEFLPLVRLWWDQDDVPGFTGFKSV